MSCHAPPRQPHRVPPRARTLLLTTLLLLLATPALAQDDAPANGNPGALPTRNNGIALELGAARVNEDILATFDLIWAIEVPVPSLACIDPDQIRCITRFRAGGQFPIHARIQDNGAPDPGLLDLSARELVGRFVQVRYIEYGYADEPVHLLLGSLSGARLGHGTIVNAYYNNAISSQLWRIGGQLNLNTPYLGGQVMTDNIFNPQLVTGRFYTRPLALATGIPFLTHITLGMSFAKDRSAPLALRRDLDTNEIIFNRFGTPEVSAAEETTIQGLDFEFDFFKIPRFKIGAFGDANWHIKRGFGTHIGLILDFEPLRSLVLEVRTEYRGMQGGYLPEYFGPTYDIERYQALGWNQRTPQPKLQISGELLDWSWRNGFSTQVGFSLFDLILFTASLSDHDRDNTATVWARAALAPTDIYQLSVFYYKTGMDSWRGALSTDDALLAAEGRLGIIWPFYLTAQYTNLWQLSSSGQYDTVRAWRLALGASFAF